MNSKLPPVPNNKVTSRSKTSSFKRPTSMEVHDANYKRESKGIFNLFKTSSNNRINEDINESNNMMFSSLQPQSAAPKSAAPKRFEGRNFGSDDEFDIQDEFRETSVTRLAKQFENAEKVMNDPAMFASFLNYLVNCNHDYKTLLFYLNTQYYQMLSGSKDFTKEAPKYIVELFTTFLADKAILQLDHEVDTGAILEDLRNGRDLQNIFEKLANDMFKDCIQDNLKKMRESILLGLCTPKENLAKLNYDAKLSCLNDVIKEMLHYREIEINSMKHNSSELSITKIFLCESLTAIKISLATIYHYYIKKEKDDISDNVSISSKGLGRSWMARSFENLQSTNFCLEKQPLFFSKSHKKGHSLFKKGKNLKGHYFMEKAFEIPTNCMSCTKLLWGLGPQGLCCTYCSEGIHKNCRDNVDKVCNKIKTFQRNHSSASSNNHYNSLSTGNSDSGHNALVTGQEEDKETDGHAFSHNNSDRKEHSDVEIDGDEKDDLKSINSMVSSDQQSNIMTTSATPSIHSNTASFSNYTNNSGSNTNQSFVSKANIVISPTNDDNTNTMSQSQIELESDMLAAMDFGYDINRNDNKKIVIRTKSDKGTVKSLASKFDGISNKSISRSQSYFTSVSSGSILKNDENMENRTMPRSSKRQSESVQVEDLVPDSQPWKNDKDMEVADTFEANVELDQFSNHVAADKDKAEYKRLLVLMELHHKIKFIVMTLKRYEYLLIKRWPLDEKILYNNLSLNSVQPLYEHIKKLAAVFESCKTERTYASDTADKVYKWLSDENNKNEYMKYSIDLCCTNLLNNVKSQWQEMRKIDPKFHKVLNYRHNKIPIVETMSNTKMMVCNLPLITKNVIHDLSKYSKFKKEVEIWKKIYEELTSLADYIDKRGAPLVDMINSNKIVNGLDRLAWQNKLNKEDPYLDYIIEFPKTIFHHKIFHFQEIKISNLRSNKDKQSPINIKETIEAYALCYDEMLVLLTKENDKFVLKQFKASDTSKINPIFSFESVHPSKSTNNQISLVFINEAVLTQLQFNNEGIMNEWYNFIRDTKSKHVSKKDTLSTVSIPKEPQQSKPELQFDHHKQLIVSLKDSHNSFDGQLKSAFAEDQSYLEPVNLTQCCLGTILDSSNLIHQAYSIIESDAMHESSMKQLLKTITNLELRVHNFINMHKSDQTSPLSQSRSVSSVNKLENMAQENEDKEEFQVMQELDEPIICENEDASNKDQSEVLNLEEIEPEIQGFESQSVNSDQSISDFIEDFVQSILTDAKLVFDESYGSEIDNLTNEIHSSSDIENNSDDNNNDNKHDILAETIVEFNNNNNNNNEINEFEDKEVLANQNNNIKHSNTSAGHLSSISEETKT